MIAILERIKSQRGQKHQDSTTAYRQLVLSIAGGKKADPTKLDELITTLDITPDEVAQHVALLQQVAGLEKQIADVDAKAAELTKQAEEAAEFNGQNAFTKRRKALLKAEGASKEAYRRAIAELATRNANNRRIDELKAANPIAFGG